MSRIVPIRSLAVLLLGLVLSSGALAAPTITVQPPEGKIHPGTPVEILYAVQWADDKDWVVEAPQWPPETGIVTSRTEMGVDANGARYYQFIVAFTPEEVGEFSVPATELHYTASGSEVTPFILDLPGTTFMVRQDRTSQYVAGGLLAVAIILIVFFVLKRFRNRTGSGGEDLPTLEQYQEALHLARQKRLDGDHYSFYHHLATLARDLDGELHKALAEKTQKVGFGGARLQDDELDSDFRALERALKKWNEEQRS